MIDTDAFNAFEAAGWEARAAEYDTYWPALTSRLSDPLLDAVEAGPDTRVLDVACGPGHLAARAAERGATAVGVDIAEPMVRIARQRSPRAEFREGVLADSPDDHDWAALRHRRCSRFIAGEGRVGRAVCDDNVTTDDPAAGQGVVAGLGGCAGCRTRAEMARRLVKRSLLGQGATRTPPSPAGRLRPACRA